MAKPDFNIMEVWSKLDKMRYSDFYCPYQSTQNIAVKCAGFPCAKFVMHRDPLGHVDFAGCFDRWFVKFKG